MGAGPYLGRVHSIQVSPGGVPKRAVPRAIVGPLGLEGDAHADGKNHGGPQRAVSLWSLEVIEVLRAEGHPIAPGAAGENVTVSGLDWAAVEPGRRISIGDEVVLRVTRPCTPCRTIARCFADGRFDRISHRLHGGVSRVYASVERPGTIRPADPVLVSAP
jgi:MOSC domain-containing protein YiiM